MDLEEIGINAGNWVDSPQKNALKLLTDKPIGKKPLGSRKCKWKDYAIITLME